MLHPPNGLRLLQRCSPRGGEVACVEVPHVLQFQFFEGRLSAELRVSVAAVREQHRKKLFESGQNGPGRAERRSSAFPVDVAPQPMPKALPKETRIRLRCVE